MAGIVEQFFRKINPTKFRQNLALLSAQSVAKKEVWPILEKIGSERFKALIDAGEPFLEAIPPDQLPEKWQHWIAMAPQYKFFISDLNETVLTALLPEWLQQIVTGDEKSKRWFLREAQWLKGRFELPQPRKRIFKAVEVKDERGGTEPEQNLSGDTGGISRSEVQNGGP